MSPGVAAPTSAGSEHASASMTSGYPRGGVTCGGPCTSDGERLSTSDASTSREAAAGAIEHPGVGAPAGVLMTSEAASSFNIGSTHTGNPSHINSSNAGV